MELKKILGAQAYWTINKELASQIGLDATVLLQHFIDLQHSFFEDGGFYQQQARLEKDLPLSIFQIQKVTKLLIKKELISVVKKGLPSKNHYTINVVNVKSLINSTTSDRTSQSEEVEQVNDQDQELKGETNNTNNTHNSYKHKTHG